jgi:YHS domain-containing protein
MTLLARLARFLFWLLILSWGVALLRHIIAWAMQSSSPSSNPNVGPSVATRRLYRDPVCGTHVSDEISLPLRESGLTLHFCSESCRDKYVSAQSLAANG